jgi:hypothetical protein
LTELEGFCYGAPTLRGFRDLTSGPQAASAKPRARSGPRAHGGLGLALVLPLLAGACGPIGYLQLVHGRARQAVSDAKRAGAERAAPYEYTSAVEYLKKAEEEGDHSEYQVAIEYGRRSEDYAKRARALATAGDRAPQPAPEEQRKGDP